MRESKYSGILRLGKYCNAGKYYYVPYLLDYMPPPPFLHRSSAKKKGGGGV